MPVDCGCVTAIANAAATAASTTLPPARSSSTPAALTAGCGLTTIARGLVSGAGAAASAARGNANAMPSASAAAPRARSMAATLAQALRRKRSCGARIQPRKRSRSEPRRSQRVRANPNARSSVGLAALLALGWLACSEPLESAATPPAGDVPPAAHPRDVAVLVVKDFGEIRFELLSDLAPQTAAHFVALAERDFFDGTTFHRVVPGAMIQAGDPNTRDRDPRNDGMGGQSESVADERPGVSHRRGIVSLANRGVP